MGYIGFSKSVNAYEAEQRGEMPLSLWDKAALVLSIVDAYGSEAAEKAEKKTVWALVAYTRWEANRYGKRKPHRYQAIATWTESGSETSIATAYYEASGYGDYWSEAKRVASFNYVERLPGKPRKNAKIWREVGEKKGW